MKNQIIKLMPEGIHIGDGVDGSCSRGKPSGGFIEKEGIMRVEFVEWDEGRGLEGLAVFGTNPIGVMLEIAIEMIENLGTDDPDYCEQKNRITTLLYEIEQRRKISAASCMNSRGK